MSNSLTTLILAIGIVAPGCAISQNVVPVESDVVIHKVHVLENDQVHMSGLIDELVFQIEGLGFEAETYSGDRPPSATHYLTFTANWSWDLAMYLTYFRATLYEDGKMLGQAEYDARQGGANMGKFGNTSEKIRPLLEEMFANAVRGTMQSQP